MNRLFLNRCFFIASFLLGLLSIVWVGAGFVGSSGLALAMTALIGAVYLLGAQEIRRYRQASAGLAQALAELPRPLATLGDWLPSVPPALQNAVRQRVESERGALPGLALTPYLIGLLVMLGMLGTFLGMVLTFQGVVFTLEGSADLQAIRSALAAPIKGLGLAFGTSVVGVATSAMLGLMSAISRRERAELARQLDAHVAGTLRPFSLAQQRQATVDALQQQAGALPAVAAQLHTLMEQLERRGQQLDEQLLARQTRFLDSASAAYSGLAQSVEQSLKQSLDASARAAGDSLKAVVEGAMGAITRASTQQHERIGALVQSQLSGLSERFSASASSVSDGWGAALQEHARTSERQVQGLDQALGAFTNSFEQRTGALITSVQDTLSRSHAEHSAAERERQAAWAQALQASSNSLQDQWRQLGAQTLAQQQAVAQGLEQTATLWRQELASLRSEEAERASASLQRLGGLQDSLNGRVASHLTSLGTALEAPIARLLDSAADAPRAAAELIAQLRQDMGRLAERDNSALQERATLMQQIDSLMRSVQQATGEQSAAIETLVASAGGVLERVGHQFADSVGAQAVRADDLATQVQVSAIELASLGEAFAHGVQLFSATNEKLVDGLQRIEGAVTQSMARSDEQLAYYVAQAREVIDLSISSQQGIVEDLRRLRLPTDAGKSA